MAWGQGPPGISQSLGSDRFGDPSTSHLLITLLQVFVGCVLRWAGAETCQRTLTRARVGRWSTTEDLHARESTSLRACWNHDFEGVENARARGAGGRAGRVVWLAGSYDDG